MLTAQVCYLCLRCFRATAWEQAHSFCSSALKRLTIPHLQATNSIFFLQNALSYYFVYQKYTSCVIHSTHPQWVVQNCPAPVVHSSVWICKIIHICFIEFTQCNNPGASGSNPADCRWSWNSLLSSLCPLSSHHNTARYRISEIFFDVWVWRNKTPVK